MYYVVLGIAMVEFWIPRIMTLISDKSDMYKSSHKTRK